MSVLPSFHHSSFFSPFVFFHVFPLVSINLLLSSKKSVALFKVGNFRVPKLSCWVPLCPPDSRGTVAAPEIFFEASFHSEKFGEVVVYGRGVDSPEDFVKFSAEASWVCSTICGSLEAWIVAGVRQYHHIFPAQHLWRYNVQGGPLSTMWPCCACKAGKSLGRPLPEVLCCNRTCIWKIHFCNSGPGSTSNPDWQFLIMLGALRWDPSGHK